MLYPVPSEASYPARAGRKRHAADRRQAEAERLRAEADKLVQAWHAYKATAVAE